MNKTAARVVRGVAATALIMLPVIPSTEHQSIRALDVGTFEFAVRKRFDRESRRVRLKVFDRAFFNQKSSKRLFEITRSFLRYYKERLVQNIDGNTRGWVVYPGEEGFWGLVGRIILRDGTICDDFVGEHMLLQARLKDVMETNRKSLREAFTIAVQEAVSELETRRNGMRMDELVGKGLWLATLLMSFRPMDRRRARERGEEVLRSAKLFFFGRIIGADAASIAVRVYAVPAGREYLLKIVEDRDRQRLGEFVSEFNGGKGESAAVRQLVLASKLIDSFPYSDVDREGEETELGQLVNDEVIRARIKKLDEALRLVQGRTGTSSQEVRVLQNGPVGDMLAPLLRFIMNAALERRPRPVEAPRKEEVADRDSENDGDKPAEDGSNNAIVTIKCNSGDESDGPVTYIYLMGDEDN